MQRASPAQHTVIFTANAHFHLHLSLTHTQQDDDEEEIEDEDDDGDEDVAQAVAAARVSLVLDDKEEQEESVDVTDTPTGPPEEKLELTSWTSLALTHQLSGMVEGSAASKVDRSWMSHEQLVDAYWDLLVTLGKEKDDMVRRFLVPPPIVPSAGADGAIEANARVWMSCVLGTPIDSTKPLLPMLRT